MHRFWHHRGIVRYMPGLTLSSFPPRIRPLLRCSSLMQHRLHMSGASELDRMHRLKQVAARGNPEETISELQALAQHSTGTNNDDLTDFRQAYMIRSENAQSRDTASSSHDESGSENLSTVSSEALELVVRTSLRHRHFQSATHILLVSLRSGSNLTYDTLRIYLSKPSTEDDFENAIEILYYAMVHHRKLDNSYCDHLCAVLLERCFQQNAWMYAQKIVNALSSSFHDIPMVVHAEIVHILSQNQHQLAKEYFQKLRAKQDSFTDAPWKMYRSLLILAARDCDRDLWEIVCNLAKAKCLDSGTSLSEEQSSDLGASWLQLELNETHKSHSGKISYDDLFSLKKTYRHAFGKVHRKAYVVFLSFARNHLSGKTVDAFVEEILNENLKCSSPLIGEILQYLSMSASIDEYKETENSIFNMLLRQQKVSVGIFNVMCKLRISHGNFGEAVELYHDMYKNYSIPFDRVATLQFNKALVQRVAASIHDYVFEEDHTGEHKTTALLHSCKLDLQKAICHLEEHLQLMHMGEIAKVSSESIDMAVRLMLLLDNFGASTEKEWIDDLGEAVRQLIDKWVYLHSQKRLVSGHISPESSTHGHLFKQGNIVPFRLGSIAEFYLVSRGIVPDVVSSDRDGEGLERSAYRRWNELDIYYKEQYPNLFQQSNSKHKAQFPRRKKRPSPKEVDLE